MSKSIGVKGYKYNGGVCRCCVPCEDRDAFSCTETIIYPAPVARAYEAVAKAASRKNMDWEGFMFLRRAVARLEKAKKG